MIARKHPKIFAAGTDYDRPSVLRIQIDDVVAAVKWPEERNLKGADASVAYEFRRSYGLLLTLPRRVKSAIYYTNSSVRIQGIFCRGPYKAALKPVFQPTDLIPLPKVAIEVKL